jgi:uncharacterized protein YprB with RNaseH-like and TPR domain
MALAPVPSLKKAEILELFRWKCKHGHRGLTHYNCWLNEVGTGERIGFLDIEASDLKANFGVMLSWCIKAEGADTACDVVTAEDLRKDLDKRIVRSCVQEMQRYDRLVTHYGDRYDLPFIRTRALVHKIPFPHHGEIVTTDVWKLSKYKLRLNSNRQDTIAEALRGVTIKTRINPTYWIRALQGDEEGLAYILDHNKKDVIELEKNYHALIPFARKANTSI